MPCGFEDARRCAVRFESMCANTDFCDTSTECFRAGSVVGKRIILKGAQKGEGADFALTLDSNCLGPDISLSNCASSHCMTFCEILSGFLVKRVFVYFERLLRDHVPLQESFRPLQ